MKKFEAWVILADTTIDNKCLMLVEDEEDYGHLSMETSKDTTEESFKGNLSLVLNSDGARRLTYATALDLIRIKSTPNNTNEA